MQLFDLTRTDPHALGFVPDLVSKDNFFYVEVKASAYDNGGVINKHQLYRFDERIETRRFYAFVYHSINRNMERDYKTEEDLRNALDLRSLFLFPFSIAKAHLEKSKKTTHPKHDDFVQIRESLAQKIYDGVEDVWKHLNLETKDYKRTKPHEKIHIITKEGHLEKEILRSFHVESIHF